MGDKEEKSLTRPKLEALYLELEKPMYNVVYRWLWDREESHDVVQETFIRLWRMRQRIDLATVKPLAYRIAINIASNRRRARQFWRWISLEALSVHAMGNPDIEDRLTTDQEIKKIRYLVEKLPERLKRVVMLCDFAGMTYEEVGRTLGIPSGTVGSRRNKALEILRENFDAFISRRSNGV